jgi:hypothetical protein
MVRLEVGVASAAEEAGGLEVDVAPGAGLALLDAAVGAAGFAHPGGVLGAKAVHVEVEREAVDGAAAGVSPGDPDGAADLVELGVEAGVDHVVGDAGLRWHLAADGLGAQGGGRLGDGVGR